MGGCRCTYKTCKVRSDGQTHMFHFPVFDKMRCHQWITNAHRPDFLNLKLSQLKNRVLCQHHFKDECFMNFMRDKLKMDAVPTEDGPFCVPDQILQFNMEENDTPTIPINAADIENDLFLSLDKKAHSSIKYGDFLISDATELFNTSHNIMNSPVSQKKAPRYPARTINLNDFKESDSKYTQPKLEDSHRYTIYYLDEDEEKKPTNFFPKKPESPAVVAIEYEKPLSVTKAVEAVPPHEREKVDLKYAKHPDKVIKILSETKISKPNYAKHPDKVVKIISEKSISEPVKVAGKLEPISPSMIIQRHKKLKSDLKIQNSNLDKNGNSKNEQNNLKNCSINAESEIKEQGIIFGQTVPVEFAPEPLLTAQELIHVEKLNEPLQLNNVNNIDNHNNFNDGAVKDNIPRVEEQVPMPVNSESVEKSIITPISTPVYKSMLRSKITPEKLAAIEEKRKFNLKLRDVITSCLDNLDEQNKVLDKNIPEYNKNSVKQTPQSETNSTNSPSSMISFLEKRLQKMEDKLLNKIDLNTQRINELKRTIKPTKNARNANTQTYFEHMCQISQKQYLYKEISKFLSTDANIKIYEELFMDKSSEDDIQRSSPRKMRKRR